MILYIYELIYTFAIMLPCLGVCAALTRPGFTFWLTAIPGCIMLPVLPLVIGCALGAVGAVLTSGSRAMGAMRYVLITVFALGLMAVSFSSSFSTGENGLLGAQPLALIGRASSAMRRYWPPLAWFSDAVWKYPIRLLLLAAVSVAGLFAFTSVAGKYDGLVADRVASVKSRGSAVSGGEKRAAYCVLCLLRSSPHIRERPCMSSTRRSVCCLCLSLRAPSLSTEIK